MNIFWHRRDLRTADNAGLYKALKKGDAVQPIFIFDQHILEELPEDDQRVLFIHQQLQLLKQKYNEHGSDLHIYYGRPKEVFEKVLGIYENVIAVYTNRDYEPYAQLRDREIENFLSQKNIQFIGTKDHVVFEKNEVLKPDDTPYKVFTPYSRKWKENLVIHPQYEFDTKREFGNLNQGCKQGLITLEEMGFNPSQKKVFPNNSISEDIINNYHQTRDLPSIQGTSRLSVHLRFGTVSIRRVLSKAQQNEKFLNELIWRDFYQMIIYHFPHSVHNSFKPEYDSITWENDEQKFKAWCEGKTGYPIVDAGMRELNETGFMHNRVRMIVASFLTKHLLIDWRWGEAYFAKKLLDFELASNVGGWQWAASSGVDAQPYFRVFNPYAQQEKFDKELKYVRKWVKEYGTSKYPKPIVNHAEARMRAIELFKSFLS